MILYEDGFIGYESNKVMSFYGIDSEENLSKNLKKVPDDWYFKDREITYEFNSRGHRCKDIENIDLDNYILFAGCSSSLGVGLDLEHTYPYQIAKQLNCDYYNLAVSGTGPDALIHNVLCWCGHIKKLPKVLIIQWPPDNRFITLSDTTVNIRGPFNSDKTQINFITAGEDCKFFESRRELGRKLLTSLYKNIINVSLEALTGYSGEYPLKLKWNDLARDRVHSGIQSNALLANEILSLLR